MKNFNKFLVSLSKNPMLIIIWLIIIAVVIFGIYKFWDFIKDKITEYQATAGYDVNKSNLSFSQSEYISMSNQLYNAMDGAGTDEEIIYSVFNKIQTKDDYNQLVKTFGIKSSSSWISSFNGDLQTWLSNELSYSERKKLNNILSKIGVSI